MNNPFGQMQNLMQRFQQFQNMFKGNANQQIQQMMNTGKINQQMYNQAVQSAQQFRRMMIGR